VTTDPREALGRDAKDGDGVIAALWWALDLLDQYDAHLVALGDDPAIVNSFAHRSAKRKARASLDAARAALRTPDEDDSASVEDGCRHCPQQGHTTAWHEAHYPYSRTSVEASDA
jgi:hypothetical protein